MAVRQLTLADTERAAATLIRLFEKDDLQLLLMAAVPDAEKPKVTRLLYEAYVRQHILKGVALAVGESGGDFETVALWLTPASIDAGLELFDTLMRLGYGALWEALNPETRHRIFSGMLPLLHDTSHRITTTTFKNKGVYTLVYLGLLESARGKGNARKMFEYMFANYIDKPGTNNIAYLESLSPTNIPIYNRFGFHVVEDIALGDDKGRAVMHVMVRDSFGNDWTRQSPKI